MPKPITLTDLLIICYASSQQYGRLKLLFFLITLLDLNKAVFFYLNFED